MSEARIAQLEKALSEANARVVKAEKRARRSEKSNSKPNTKANSASQGQALPADGGAPTAAELRALEMKVAELEAELESERFNAEIANRALESLQRELKEAGIELAVDAEDHVAVLSGLKDEFSDEVRQAAYVGVGQRNGEEYASMNGNAVVVHTNAKELIESLRSQLAREREEYAALRAGSREQQLSLGGTAEQVVAALQKQIEQKNADIEELESRLAAQHGTAAAAAVGGMASEPSVLEQKLRRTEKQLEALRASATTEAIRQETELANQQRAAARAREEAEKAIADAQLDAERRVAQAKDEAARQIAAARKELTPMSAAATDIDHAQRTANSTQGSGLAGESEATLTAARAEAEYSKEALAAAKRKEQELLDRRSQDEREIASLRDQIVQVRQEMHRLREAAEAELARAAQREQLLEQEKLELELNTIDTLKEHISELNCMWEAGGSLHLQDQDTMG